MNPLFFKNTNEFRKWLEKNHKVKSELQVGFYKVGSGKPSMTWSDAVDQALCFGWIDGIRRSIDEESYTNRFTPRKKNSTWSVININKVKALVKAGLMKPAGMEAFSHRKENKSGTYSHENETKTLAPSFEKQFKKNKSAWKFFIDQPPSYRKVVIHWIMTAKQDKTKSSRLEKTIKASEENKRL